MSPPPLSAPMVMAHFSCIQGGPQTDTQFNFWDNFGNSPPIKTILSLLQEEIYGA